MRMTVIKYSDFNHNNRLHWSEVAYLSIYEKKNNNTQLSRIALLDEYDTYFVVQALIRDIFLYHKDLMFIELSTKEKLLTEVYRLCDAQDRADTLVTILANLLSTDTLTTICLKVELKTVN